MPDSLSAPQLPNLSRGTQSSVEWDTLFSMFGAGAPTPQNGKGPEMLMVLRVIKADLLQSCEIFGKMDPFVKVNRTDDDGSTWEIAETATHWNGHKTPFWDHTCRAQPARDFAQVEFVVMERNVVVSNTFCGSIRIGVMDLLVGSSTQQSSSGNSGFMGGAAVVSGGQQELQIYRKNVIVGTITVQASLVMSTDLGQQTTSLTRVDAALFANPVKRLGVSGGTAPFFQLWYKGGDKSQNYFIGKDLCRAEGEVVFYEEAIHLRNSPGSGGMGPLLDFLFEYLGVLTCDIEGAPAGSHPKELLVMRNLRDGCKSLRMLDIKVGQKTSSKNWRGKSRLRALRQDFVDGLTNSACEGFRLEGFDGPPPTLESMDPVLDLGRVGPLGNLSIGAQSGLRKKALRMMLQRIRASEMLMHFFDVHHSPLLESSLSDLFSPTEVAELVLHEMVIRLTALAIACRCVLVPQKWVGSSVALGFDAGWQVPRSEERAFRSHVKVNIFDWGRSELNDVGRYQTFTKQEQADRAQFWRYYVGGVDRLAWEAARAYWHRFSNAKSWTKVSVAVYDFDAGSSNDFIGHVDVPVEDSHGSKVVELLPQQSGITSAKRRQSGNQMYLTYSMKYVALPAGARLAGLWRMTLIEAKNLIAMDTWGTSDPFAVVTAFSQNEEHVLSQQTSVIVKNLFPTWNETIDLPVAAGPSQLSTGLQAVAPGLMNISNPGTFFAEDGSSSSTDAMPKNVDTWVQHLDKAAQTIARFEKPAEISSKLYPRQEPADTTKVPEGQLNSPKSPYLSTNSPNMHYSPSCTTNNFTQVVQQGTKAPRSSVQNGYVFSEPPSAEKGNMDKEFVELQQQMEIPDRSASLPKSDLSFWQRCCTISCKQAPQKI